MSRFFQSNKNSRRPPKLPSTMRAAAIDRFGRPNVLTPHVLPVPAVESGDVLIAVHTAGVGSWDADMREGWSPDGGSARFPLVLGTDGSGTVAAVGSRVRRCAPGDIVYAYSFANRKGDFYAEYVAVVAEHVGHPPDSLMLTEAGAVATTGLTALQEIDDVLRITRSARLCCAYGPMPPDASSAIDSTPQEREPVLSCPPQVSQCITNMRTIWSD